ncbi:hypothetical protein BRADI_5g13185v3 [Brachypodium distachyon]|uniref:Uncharacterized protein n=1 Tax=Brachypodium distachyon TaxID=15368 RepID=A0A2K2CGY4_BRADI|nr:hypothetical protein BRADI_5g13185v3 [Brachypodium distachyon]
MAARGDNSVTLIKRCDISGKTETLEEPVKHGRENQALTLIQVCSARLQVNRTE